MTVTYLADAGDIAGVLGRILGTLLLPGIGLTLLLVGLRKRSAARKQAAPGYGPGYPPGYPPNYPAPPGYPPAPGQPGPPGYPPGAGYPLPVPLPQPKPAGTPMIVTGIVLLVLGALGVVFTIAGVASTHSRPSIGDCYTNVILSDKPNWKPTSCSDADAVLQYAANADALGNCPDGKRDDSGYLSAERDHVRMCFAPNLLQGQCYVSERDGQTVRHTSCTTSDTVRVVKRVEGSNDKSACPKRTRAVTYPEPKRLYCTERAGDN